MLVSRDSRPAGCVGGMPMTMAAVGNGKDTTSLRAARVGLQSISICM
jgi:hypothetical protein